MRSLKNTHFRSCLEEIMGRERAPFDDQKWNEKLMKKVMADLERRLDENERKLAEAETRRILKLKLMGITNGHEWEEEEKRRHSHKSHKKTAAEKKFEKRNQLVREAVFRPSEDIETQMEILHRDESQVKRRSNNNNNNNADQDSDDVDGSTTSPADGDDVDKINQQGAQLESEENHKNSADDRCVGGDKREMNQHLTLRKLFEEEDLRQLYREAENLVRVVAAGTSKVAKK